MSQTADSQSSDPTGSWQRNRDQLFEMIMHGRSFSGRERNCCFLNTDGKWFATASSLSGFDFPDDGRCIATTDWDRDGDVDVWTSNRSAPRIRFLRNNAHRQNAFLQFKLIGDGVTTNRDAIGARLEVSLHNGKRIVKTLRAGEGFLSQSSKSIHVGLGTESQIDQVRIVWPNSQHSEQVFSNVALNQRYVVTQGNANLSIESAVPSASLDSFAATPLTTLAATDVARVPMLTQLPMPQLDHLSLQTAPQTISFRTQEPTLVVLWATWCQPCLAELTALANQETQLAAKQIRIIALCR
ncbi:MAG: ASPIC/UnbV domain-containing protein [Pirellulaceae bacterium]